MRLPLLTCSSKRAASGISLVVVLGSLVLLSSLVVAFLVQMGTELRSSRVQADGASARILSQSAANIVMTQIQNGTSGRSGSSILAWASQPGMIRTYDTSGDAFEYFKLYSDDTMSGSGAFDAVAASSAFTTWFQNKALYTDLNQPIQVNGVNNYPILNGLDADLVTVTGVPGRTYNSDGDNSKADIDGFYINGAPTVSATDNQAPMPVKWLYVLANGEIVAPTATGAGHRVQVTGAGAANPIVGRIAFWTDDDTCKININSVGEGVYWDTPRTKNVTEDIFKRNQPVNGEYQRYPGHPAMTSLSAVVKYPNGWASTIPVPSISLPGLTGSVKLCTPERWKEIQWANRLYEIIPRIREGGSKAGSEKTAWATTTAPTVIVPDSDRLFASVDELLYKKTTGTGGNRNLNDPDPASPTVLNKANIERARFFLTATSRAPDVNIFNKPRVCNWPITLDKSSSQPVTSPYDQLIAFCTTMRNDLGANAYHYYFQRKDPNSPTVDLPTNGSATGLGRNRMLIEYLRGLMGQDIPGFGRSFRDKYGSDTDQILTEMFDYVRASTNLFDATVPSVSSRYTIDGLGTYKNGRGQVVPIDDASITPNTHGFGRFRTIQGASLLFVGQADGDVPDSQFTYTGAALNPAVPPGHIRVQARFIPQFFDPSVGVPFDRPNFKWQVDLSQLKWGPGLVSMGFPSGTTYTHNTQPVEGSTFGDQFGVNQVSKPESGTIDLPKSGNLQFGQADVTFTLRGPNSDVVQTIVLRFEGGSFPLPELAPKAVKDLDGTGKPRAGTYNFRYFQGRLSAVTSSKNAAAWFVDQDLIRSVGVKSGDTRLVAAQKNPPAPGQAGYPFAVNAQYNRGNRVLGAHNFLDGYGRPYYGAQLGRLAPGLNYLTYTPADGIFRGNKSETAGCFNIWVSCFTAASDVPLNGVAVGKDIEFNPGDGFSFGDVPGDWDNGPSDVRDGPFINKPDEGDAGGTSAEPYSWKFAGEASGAMSNTLFTPNRQIPSAIMFGSLPSGVRAGRPWQTLLFRPQPVAETYAIQHPGGRDRAKDGTESNGMPADHLLVDLFHMPVVEPYAISEPLSTAGRINMNYQIVPFTYINRDTGIRAILKSEKVIAIQDGQADVYKQNDFTNPQQANIRLDVDANETLVGFQQRFDSGDIFRSATEICEIPIVPQGATNAGMLNFWSTHRLTGDNSKERPYATIYPRLTTKSNTFTVHIRAQSLKQNKRTPADEWIEGVDQITGEYRGSQTIERYVDPNHSGDPSDPLNLPIPDFANPATTGNLSQFYKFRVVSTKQFAP